jgi:hypothetical protein
MTDDLGRVTDAEVTAALANGSAALPPAKPRNGRGLFKLAILFGAFAVILSQVAQLQATNARGDQVRDLRVGATQLQTTIDRLRDRVALLDAELGCRSIIAGELEVATAEAEDVILRGLSAIAAAGPTDPATLAGLAVEARQHADTIRAAIAARAKSVELCSSAPTTADT